MNWDTDTTAKVSLAISILAMLSSWVAAIYIRSQAASARSQAEDIRTSTELAVTAARLADEERRAEQLAKKEAEAVKMRADVTVEAVPSGSGHRLTIKNNGPAKARDVRVAFLESLDKMPQPLELKDLILVGDLAPLDTREVGVTSPGTTRDYRVRMRYGDDENIKIVDRQVTVPSTSFS